MIVLNINTKLFHPVNFLMKYKLEMEVNKDPIPNAKAYFQYDLVKDLILDQYMARALFVDIVLLLSYQIGGVNKYECKDLKTTK